MKNTRVSAKILAPIIIPRIRDTVALGRCPSTRSSDQAKLNSRISGDLEITDAITDFAKSTRTHSVPPSGGGRDMRRDHVSRLIFPALAPATLQRSLFSFHRDFLSPNSTSPPLFNTESSRVSVSSTILDAFPTLFVHGRGGESEVGIVAPTVNRGKESLSRSNRSREREKERKRGADFRGIQCPRGGCDCAPLRGTIRGTVREERGGVGGEKREIIAARPSRLLPSQDRT